MTTLIGFSLVAAPFLVIAGLFRLVGGIRARYLRSVARQIALTDAIHRELGAVAAPFVRQRGRAGWQVRVAVPLDCPATVGAIVRVIQQFFSARDGASGAGLEVVLTPWTASRRLASSPLRRPVPVSAARMVGAAR